MFSLHLILFNLSTNETLVALVEICPNLLVEKGEIMFYLEVQYCC